MSRSIRNGVAYDQRTGFKVRGHRLREDGETGHLTTDPDIKHEQSYVRTPTPDGVSYRQGPAPQHSIPSNTYLKPFMDPVTMKHVPMPCLSLSLPPSFITGDE
jgi:hypothetical protein